MSLNIHVEQTDQIHSHLQETHRKMCAWVTKNMQMNIRDSMYIFVVVEPNSLTQWLVNTHCCFGNCRVSIMKHRGGRAYFSVKCHGCRK